MRGIAPRRSTIAVRYTCAGTIIARPAATSMQALKSDANNAEAWLNRAIVSLQQGGDAEALPWIEKSLALNTARPALAYYSRSIAYERTGNLRAAYADLRRAVELAPGWRAPLEDLKRYQVRRR